MGWRHTLRAIGLGALLLLGACLGGSPPPSAGFDEPTASQNAEFTVTVDPDGGTLHRGANQLTVQVAATDGTAGVLTHVSAYMPLHGHSAVPPTIVDDGNGQFSVVALDLMMSGEWQLTLTLSRTGATDDDQAVLSTDVP